jgi:putative membrane protein
MDAMGDASDADVTRRTHLAAERTWLAWWRSGITAATASVGIGGVVPQLVGGSRVPYVMLGAGYALLSMAMFVVGGRRQTAVEQALERGDYQGIPPQHVLGFTVAGAVLALGTLVAVVVNL